MKQIVYVAILITNNDGEMNVNVMGAGYNEASIEELAGKQRRFMAPTQVIDIFEVEEVL